MAGVRTVERRIRWSFEDLEMVQRLALAGVPAAVIARKLDRTETAVRNVATKHGIKLQAKRLIWRGRDAG